MIELDLSRTKISKDKLEEYQREVTACDRKLKRQSKSVNGMAGWLRLPEEFDKEELKKIQSAAKKIRKNSDVLVVIGIGGSYLGARAVIELFKSNLNKKGTEVVFVGNNLSTKYIADIIEYLQDKEFSINVISKSGTTTEPAIAFRIFEELLVQKYGIKEAKDRIYVTTDANKGALKEIAKKESYETFNVPNNIGGRYSVLTPVGLLPIASAGIDISKLLDGAKTAMDKYSKVDILENDCYMYAVTRYILSSKKDIEIIAAYEPSFLSYIEWIKQLFNESEGKDSKGLFTTGAIMTTDLHSIGQNIQDGKRNIFETVINVMEMNIEDIVISLNEENLDGLNYLEGDTIDYINKTAMEATLNAHLEGDVPNILITLEKLDEKNIGEIIYFFEKACSIYCFMLGVNPFDQPGVEKYKYNMFKMLGKPGYTE